MTNGDNERLSGDAGKALRPSREATPSFVLPSCAERKCKTCLS